MVYALVSQVMKPRLPVQSQQPIPYPAICDDPTHSLKSSIQVLDKTQKGKCFPLLYRTRPMIVYRLVKLLAVHGFGGWTDCVFNDWSSTLAFKQFQHEANISKGEKGNVEAIPRLLYIMSYIISEYQELYLGTRNVRLIQIPPLVAFFLHVFAV